MSKPVRILASELVKNRRYGLLERAFVRLEKTCTQAEIKSLENDEMYVEMRIRKNK